MAKTSMPIGFLFPVITMFVFSYEILCFYFWSLSRRYADLIDIVGLDPEAIGRVHIPMEDAN